MLRRQSHKDRTYRNRLICPSLLCRISGTGLTATGLGTFLQFNSAGNNFDVMIQVPTSTASSPLQAEAQGLLLAVKLGGSSPRIHNPTFLKDNLTLVKTATIRRFRQDCTNWEIKHNIAEYLLHSAQLNPAVYRIPRNLNGVTHNCAQQVLSSQA